MISEDDGELGWEHAARLAVALREAIVVAEFESRDRQEWYDAFGAYVADVNHRSVAAGS